MDMVVTGIQAPKSMQKTENPQVSRSMPIPAASGSHHIVSSYYSASPKNSAFVSSRLQKDSPQRSAGSFNVHPIRKPIMSSELKDHHSTASEVDHDENDVVMCWSNPAAEVGAPSCALSLINGNSCEDQSVSNPKLSSDYLHSCEIEEPKTLNVGVVASITSDMIRISSADSMSTASSRSVVSHASHDSPIKSVSFSEKFVKEDESRHSSGENVSDYSLSSHVLCKEEAQIYKEKLISMEEEDDSFAYSLQEEFWAQNGTLCESADAILQDDPMVNTLFIDIPTSASSNESSKSIHTAHAKHPVSTISTFDRINMGSSYSINSSDSLQYSDYGILGSSPSLGEIDFCETCLVAGVDESSHPEKNLIRYP